MEHAVDKRRSYSFMFSDIKKIKTSSYNEALYNILAVLPNLHN